jgi:hypothetical protein
MRYCMFSPSHILFFVAKHLQDLQRLASSLDMTQIRLMYLGALFLASMELVATRGMGDIIAAEIGLSDTDVTTIGSFSNASMSVGYSNSTVATARAPNDTDANACWSSWTNYWVYTKAIASPRLSYLTTTVSTTTVCQSQYFGTTETAISTFKGTSVQDNGGFTISTKTLDSTSTTVYTIDPRPGSSYTKTTTITSYTLVSYNGSSVPMPTCTLSSVVSQCHLNLPVLSILLAITIVEGY